MKKILVILLLSLSLSKTFSQASLLRDIVCVVTAGYQNSMATGSGYVVNTVDGVNMIISNHHVVSNSRRFRVIFYPNEGPEKVFNSVRIAGRLPEYDIAILAFAGDEKVFSQGLKLDLSPPDDGEQVCAAGYPGGSWLYSEGMVSNRRALVRLSSSSGISQPFIQHSALIHEGSSGGPLLVKNPNAPYGYSVVGINTLRNDHGMYFSIPVSRIMGLLDTVWKQFHEYHMSSNTMETALNHILEAPVFASIKSPNESFWIRFPADVSHELAIELEATENILLETHDEQGTFISSVSGRNIRHGIKGETGGIYLKVSSPDIRFWSTFRLKARLLQEGEIIINTAAM